MASAKNATVTSTNVKSSMNRFFLSRRSDVIQRNDQQGTPNRSSERGLRVAQKSNGSLKEEV
jgi:hypothetical protein